MPNAKPAYADVDSVWVKCNCGKAYSALLTTKDGYTYELRGARMQSWLDGWWQRCRALKTTSQSNSLRTSKGYVKNDRQAHFAWEKT